MATGDESYDHLDDGQIVTLAGKALREAHTDHTIAGLQAYARYQDYMNELSRRQICRVLAYIAEQNAAASGIDRTG